MSVGRHRRFTLRTRAVFFHIRFVPMYFCTSLCTIVLSYGVTDLFAYSITKEGGLPPSVRPLFLLKAAAGGDAGSRPLARRFAGSLEPFEPLSFYSGLAISLQSASLISVKHQCMRATGHFWSSLCFRPKGNLNPRQYLGRRGGMVSNPSSRLSLEVGTR